jgi:hypothetical protein
VAQLLFVIGGTIQSLSLLIIIISGVAGKGKEAFVSVKKWLFTNYL